MVQQAAKNQLPPTSGSDDTSSDFLSKVSNGK